MDLLKLALILWFAINSLIAVITWAFFGYIKMSEFIKDIVFTFDYLDNEIL